jgi:flavin-dependent dehydrogenase
VKVDLLVAGAGPSGLAAAIAGAQRGLSVLVVDPQEGVIDKACGEGLMPTAVSLLNDLGVPTPTGRPFLGIRYLYGDQHADGYFPGGPGLGVRRLALHQALTTRAETLGVLRQRGRVDAVEQHTDHVQAGDIEARWLIAADGLRSPLRHQLGLDRPSTRPRRYGLRQHFRVRPWSDLVEVYWADDAEAYVTPVDEDLVGIAFLFGDEARAADHGRPGAPFSRLLDRFPRLRERIGEAPAASHPRGAGPFAVEATHQRRGRVLLVGDAAGYLDPITGEGIKLGIGGAIAAVDAIVAGDVEGYERAWGQMYRPYAVSTGGLLAVTRVPWVRRWMVPVLQRVPRAFGWVLGAVVG